jgi:hypothetical protein
MKAVAAWLVLVAASAVTPSLPAAAEPSIAGAWTLVSYTREDPATGAVTYPLGRKPTGTLFLLPGGRVAVVIAGEGREPAPPGSEGYVEKQAKLFQTMTAYSGTWSVKGSALTMHVDVSYRPEWVGTDQKREFRLEGDTLHVRTLPTQSVSDGKTYVYVLVWRRLPDAAP